jgi:nucleoside-diphosphate-sugar epimerase
MRILVTGGSGFVGSRMIPKLVSEGHDVFALVRSTDLDGRAAALGARHIRGDLDQPANLSLPALDAIVHTAAHFRFAGPRARYFRTNVEGTRALLRAGEKAGATRFVHLSAGGVVMDDRGSPICDADEQLPTFPHSFSAYIASKAQGETAVLQANKVAFQTIAIRPPTIWGPGDPFSRGIPEAIKSGRFAFIDRGDYLFATCHVDNVIEAIQCALERGEGGRAYFIDDQETVTFRAFIADLAKVQGLSIDGLKSISYSTAFNLGRLMEIGATLTFSNKDPPLTRTMARMIGRQFTINDAMARAELEYAGKVSRLEGLAAYPGAT